MLYFSIITLCVLIFLVSEFLLYLIIADGLKKINGNFFHAFVFPGLLPALILIVIISAMATLPLLYLTDIHWFYLSVLTGYAVLFSYVDIRYHKLPDVLTVSFLIFGLMLNTHNVLTEFHAAVAGVLVGYLFISALHIIYRIAFKKISIGLGDAKLLAAIGAIVGLEPLPEVVLVASISCLLVIFLRKKIFGVELNKSIFYAPFLMLGLFVALI